MSFPLAIPSRVVLALSLLLAATFRAAAADRPNIVVILSDDMGYSDLGCYGGEIRTPNLDALAAGGVRFTQFYNTARCCPTRASLLTGLHPHQAGVGHMTSDGGRDGYRGQLNDRCVTIAEALRPGGYRTYMCGKWHVSRNTKPDGDKSVWPVQRGFEKFYGTINGGGSFYDPTSLCRQNTFITPENDPDYKPAKFYYTDAITDNAVRFLQQHGTESPDKPFFMYVAYTAAHWPMHAPEEEIAKYKGKYDGGYEPTRVARLAKMKALGLVPPDLKLSPVAGDWAAVKDKAWEARCMEVYAAMVDRMDQGIGRIVDQLKRDGRLENTLVLFLQDNGGCAEEMGRKSNGDGPGNLKPFGPNDLQPKVWPPMQTRDGRWVRSGPGVMPGGPDTYVAYGQGWANVSNTPFREYKHWIHEGGISTPLIAHWPAGIPADRRGKLEPQPGQLVDLMATCVDLSGVAYPKERDGKPVQPMEGTSLRPALLGQPIGREKPLVWEHEANRAVRDGKWKLVAKENEPWELYDLDADRSELNDLAAKDPERVRSMAATWDAWAARANVLPLGAWRGKGAEPAAGGGADGSPAKRFELKAGQHLDRGQSPAVAGKAFTLTVTFDAANAAKGVLVAQGGTAHGYALYLDGGRLSFVARTAGKKATATTADPIAPGEHTAVAKLDAAGKLTLSVDGKTAGTADLGRTLASMPVDGVDVGSDAGGLVGPYGESNQFGGTIKSVVIDVGEK
ncbi:MAG TPA: arylsulfatase [Humisphaera sp.]